MNEQASQGDASAADADIPLRVLVVDDDVEVAAALSAFLSVTGIAAEAVHDVDTALGRVANDPRITVVVSDLRMPGKDGLALASELREGTPEALAVEVVMITAHATSEVAFSAGRNSIFAFLQKPFRPQNLGKVVREAHATACDRRAKAHTGAPAEEPNGPAEPLPEGSPVRVINDAVALSGVTARPISVVVDTSAAIGVDPGSLAAALAAVIVEADAVADRHAVITISAGDERGDMAFGVTVMRAPFASDGAAVGAAGRSGAAGLAHAAGGRLQLASEAGAEYRAAIIVPTRPTSGR